MHLSKSLHNNLRCAIQFFDTSEDKLRKFSEYNCNLCEVNAK